MKRIALALLAGEMDEGLPAQTYGSVCEARPLRPQVVGAHYGNLDSEQMTVPLHFPMGAWHITDIGLFIEGEAHD
jgi:hypothetical protein